MGAFIDLVGARYGRLTVVARGGRNRWGNWRWLCRCECGKDREVDANSLRRGLTVSCGCYRNDRIRETCVTHGDTGSSEYAVWCSMIQRCNDPNIKGYSRYGGRGIAVCDRWRDSYEAFLEDMGRRPTPGHTIERTDNDLGYSPDNCRWATRTEQARNTRRNRLITHGGQTLSLAGWSEATGLNAETISDRLGRGWSVEDALTSPLPGRSKTPA